VFIVRRLLVGVLVVVPFTVAIGIFAASGAIAASRPQALVPHCAPYFPVKQTQICSARSARVPAF
jgi:hypothetical protein